MQEFQKNQYKGRKTRIPVLTQRRGANHLTEFNESFRIVCVSCQIHRHIQQRAYFTRRLFYALGALQFQEQIRCLPQSVRKSDQAAAVRVRPGRGPPRQRQIFLQAGKKGVRQRRRRKRIVLQTGRQLRERSGCIAEYCVEIFRAVHTVKRLCLDTMEPGQPFDWTIVAAVYGGICQAQPGAVFLRGWRWRRFRNVLFRGQMKYSPAA